jgi:hypothetical protein
MQMISDVLLAAGAFGAAIYCYVLALRLKRFSTLESGMGGAIAVLSAQVDDMTRALDRARSSATGSASSLEALNQRAESVAARLEILLAAMHDLPDPKPPVEPEPAEAERRVRFVRRRSSREMEAAE